VARWWVLPPSSVAGSPPSRSEEDTYIRFGAKWNPLGQIRL
jgi:hypothetical protein